VTMYLVKHGDAKKIDVKKGLEAFDAED